LRFALRKLRRGARSRDAARQSLRLRPMNQPDDLLQQLAAAGEQGDDDLALGETALALAALDHKGIVLQPYREHLAKLADDARASVGVLRRGMSEIEALS